jgi:predicted nucleic acid-binding protein
MSPVFLDTVGLLALWDLADQWHAAAEAAFSRLMTERVPLKTTTFVLLECANASARRPYRLEVQALRQTLEARGDVVIPTPADWTHAWEA